MPELGDREELRRRHGLDGPTLVFAGRLAPVKSLDTALEALRQVEGVSLVIAGDGPERAGLERLAEGLPVRFLGPQPRETVLELFAAADAVLLPSSWENFPHAVVEGLAVGTPVIATAVGGVTEIVTDGVNGLLVPRGTRARSRMRSGASSPTTPCASGCAAAAAGVGRRLRARAGLRPHRGAAARGGGVKQAR